jgi:hypothetical protein
MQERLSSIKAKLRRKNVAVYYVLPNPRADFFFDTESAEDDLLWMIAEIERLRIQVNDLSSPRDSGPREPASSDRVSLFTRRGSPKKPPNRG